MNEKNQALWMPRRGSAFEVGDAPMTPPGPGEVVVRVRAVAINPLDAMSGPLYRVAFPWVRFPAVIGADVAGDIVDIGAGVTRLAIGERVLGYATGLEKSRHRAAEGAFQHYVVLMQQLVAPIPDDLSFEQASVLPLTLSTAAVGLFQRDQLALELPTANAPDRGATVLVWGASTSLGSNAVQLARQAGYRVIATASPRNFDYVRSLGADAVVDYRSTTAVDELVALVGDQPLAGAIAIGSGSLPRCVDVAARATGRRRVATAMLGPATVLATALARARRVRVSSIWGGSLKDNEIGEAIFASFLPQALASGSYVAAPPASVVGSGLAAIPAAIEQFKAGVSASKLVVSI